MPPPTPIEETVRLDALWRASILDTGEEDVFEDLIDLLQAAVQAPHVLVCLVDERRLWFKARRGVERTEVPRRLAISAHTILSDAPLVVDDVGRDPRFRDTPFVAGQWRAASYAGAPIVLSAGARIGVVCAADRVPRAWSPLEILHLQRGARIAARHIDARRADLEKDRQRFLEQALQRAETRYEAILKTMTEGVVVQGPSGAIVDSNPAASDLLGLSAEDLFGRLSRDPRWCAVRCSGEPFPGEEHPPMVALRTGLAQLDVTIGIRTPQGEHRWLSVNSYPVYAPGGGRVDHVISVFHRISAPCMAAAA